MSIKSRLDRLEAKQNDGDTVYHVYFHDEGEGYYTDPNGPHYETREELARAQGWETGKAVRVIEVRYSDDNRADD